MPRRRRAAVRAAGALGALVLALTGCTADPPAPPDLRPDDEVTTTTAAEVEQLNNAVVAVDDLGPGFNPHRLADLSPVTTMVSGLVLPSVFRPTDGGGWLLDASVASSASVTSTAPFTVTYQLRDEAQWSDGAPVAAEDFRYLWQQMTTQPGVVDPAGYRLVDEVTSSAGGKTVTVVFAQPYEAWRELFDALLPSHLLKDSPGGFTSDLDDGVAVSAGRFAVRAVDRDRGEVELERNDRFWDAPAELDSLLLRRDGTPGQLAESLRTNDVQLAQVHADLATRAQVGAVPGLLTRDVAQPAVLQVAVDTVDPRLAEPGVRRAVLAALDADVLTTVGTGLEPASTLRAQAQLLAPSQPGYTPTAPDAPTADEAEQLLTAAGWELDSGRWRQGAAPFTLVVGADAADLVGTAVAQATADQLTAAGFTASVSLLSSEELYGQATEDGDVDLVVGRVAAGHDPAATLASRFGCPLPEDGSVAGPSETTPADAPTTTPDPDGTPAGAVSLRGGNPSGLCTADLQATVEAVLDGSTDLDAVRADVEDQLWDLAAVLPLYQDATLLAVRPELTGVGVTEPLLGGPAAGAPSWGRSDR